MNTPPPAGGADGTAWDDRDAVGAGSAASDGQPLVHPPLRRSSRDRVIAGVAGALARSLDIDAALVRIALVVLAVAGGAGVLLYVVAWIALPEARPGEIPTTGTHAVRSNSAIALGAILLLAGGLLLADGLARSIPSLVGPIALIALGGAVILGPRR